ncbi:fimbrial protein [Enterobacter sp. RHBSTW-00901]|uniref:fimbrial protein n=1 Tax=Enterobacter sp. RHBSTW-00901 TaxID=2742669 RepID=UPI0015F4D7DC|nr:fimbrial protein [Enterobacter sp. RHBSTW-00901]MBA7853773.1 fimbrial protein [Enterobacter sp. RHBSTW-00901]
MKKRKSAFYLYHIVWVIGAWFSQSAWAICEVYTGVISDADFSIPPLVVNSDAAIGTILYSQDITMPNVYLRCNAIGDIYQGYTVLTDADHVTNAPAANTYATNVPGIGIRSGWANDGGALDPGNLLTPWHKGTSTVGAMGYNFTLNAAIQVVVTGPVSSGTLDTSRLVADWKYDNLVVGKLRFSASSVNVQANTCTLAEKNITVPLMPISTDDFDNKLSAVVSDDSFRIQLDKCEAGIKVDYKFTTSGSTGVSNNNILSIASGSGAAEGVGIQILDSNNTVVQFDTEYEAAAQTTKNQSVSIPLKARYIQTGTVKGGDVNAVATFEIYYR